MQLSKSLRLMRLGALALVAGAVVGLPAGASFAAGDVSPVTLRLASDLVGPPHPAAIAIEFFKERLAQEIPGSEVRVFYAGALYRIPEAVEAMTEGNLEMTWGQFGKTAQVDPFMNVVIGPQMVTTPGAINALENFDTVKMLKDRLAKIHNVKVFGTAHMSMYMGAGAGFRLLSPGDFAGKKIRSMGPAENAALKAWGANPTTMAFGDVPPALQTGVIDGLLTSLGGFNNVKDQAPYYTVAGINGVVGDYYWIGASLSWWNKLDSKQQAIIEKILVDEVLPFEKTMNWCNDRRLLDKFETKDSAKPGIYIMKAAEQKILADKLGTATADWVKANTPDDANSWVDKFAAEAKAAVAAHPMGSDPLEKTDCTKVSHYFTKYKK
ncbi:MAG: TRAP transporter substrate-binding protein DctP [Proteobacteria bacterium]|nr:TRAP transporter substrate-binding protein DctP [Pseudomonadota bacterium]MDA1310398.1 TRAP transporter substrate-binding protein DctP [Pseudomonadota bacterium]